MRFIKSFDEKYLNNSFKKIYLKLEYKLPTLSKRINAKDRKIIKHLSQNNLRQISGINLLNVTQIRYFETLNISYNAIPKNGHTNVMIIFNEILQTKKTNLKSIRRHGRLYKNLLNIDEHYKIFKSYKFTFSRNPYIRALSMYRYLFEKKHLSDQRKKDAFIEFLRFLKFGGINLNMHFMPQVDLLFFELEDFDFIGRLENFAEDFKELLLRIECEPSVKALELIEKKSNTKHVTLSEKYLKDYYSSESIKLVQQIYKKDFEYFGYDSDYKSI